MVEGIASVAVFKADVRAQPLIAQIIVSVIFVDLANSWMQMTRTVEPEIARCAQVEPIQMV